MAFTINYNDEPFELDYFAKVIMFQKIIDLDINKNTKSVLLYVLRKTLCFDKFEDRLSMYHLQQKLELSSSTLRKSIEIAEEKQLLKVTRSKGGDMQSNKRFNKFRLSDSLIIELIDFIEEVRYNNDFK